MLAVVAAKPPLSGFDALGFEADIVVNMTPAVTRNTAPIWVQLYLIRHLVLSNTCLMEVKKVRPPTFVPAVATP